MDATKNKQKEKGTVRVPLDKCELEYDENSGKLGISCGPDTKIEKIDEKEVEETKEDKCIRFEFSGVKVKRS